MSNKLDGKVWDMRLNRYVDEFPETEEGDALSLIEHRHAVSMGELPTSPKSLCKLSTSMGWEARAWLTIGVVPPTLYLHDSEQDMNEGDDPDQGPVVLHAAGDVKSDGYTASLYVVEARASVLLPLGFRAHFLGRDYGADDKRNKAGGFDHAWVADPVGVVRQLGFEYKPIKVSIGRDIRGRVVETEKSFKGRQDAEALAARYLDETCNDGAFMLDTRSRFTSSTALTAWLKEWATYGRLLNA